MSIRYKQILAWAFLALALAVLFCGIKLARGVRPVETTTSVSEIIGQLKDKSLPVTNRVRACLDARRASGWCKTSGPGVDGRSERFELRCQEYGSLRSRPNWA